MTEDYYLSIRLFMRDRILIHKYNAQLDHQYGVTGQYSKSDFFENNRLKLEKIKKRIEKYNQPMILVEDMDIFYGAFLDYDGNLFLYGPCVNRQLSDIQLNFLKKNYGIEELNFSIEEKKFETLANILCIAYFYTTKKMLNENEILFEWINKKGKYIASSKEIDNYQLDKSENHFQYNTYDFELKYLSAVENGDVGELVTVLQSNSQAANKVGMLAKNNKKRMEYMQVASIALVTRAAIRGKMNPNQAYELGDIYLQKLEYCSTIEEMSQLGYEMQLDFTQKVHDIQIRERGAIYIEQCKDYITKHLRTSFYVNDIAKAISINPAYLSRKFSEQEGVTIQQYIYRERCIKAANMMKYTNYTIAEIAEYLCFSSQSHFGKRFKECFGETPYQYRKKNKYIETFD